MSKLATELARPVDADAEAAPTAYVLRGLTGIIFGRTYSIHRPLTIGRLSDCDIRIEDASLSRTHVRLVPMADGILVEDLRSTNGTFVNDQRIAQSMARVGDEIRLDRIRFRIDRLSPKVAPSSSPAPASKSARSWALRRRWALAIVLALNIAGFAVYLWSVRS